MATIWICDECGSEWTTPRGLCPDCDGRLSEQDTAKELEKTLGAIKYAGAKFVGSILRVVAVVVAVAGFLLAIGGGANLLDDAASHAALVGYVAGTLMGTAIAAGLLGAAGYAVTLLVDIYDQTAETRYLLEDAANDAEPKSQVHSGR